MGSAQSASFQPSSITELQRDVFVGDDMEDDGG